MILRFSLLILLFFQQGLSAQDLDYSALLIPAELKENADAVIRLEKTDVTIVSAKLMKVKKVRITTVLNENGNDNIDAVEYFDKSTDVKSIEAFVYDANGQQLKKLKRKDFKDVSVSQGSIITDNRMLYLDYTPVQYPYTIVFTSESETSNTAFLPRWSASEGDYASLEKSSISYNYVQGLGFKYKEYNFDAVPVKKEETSNSLVYSVENIPAMRGEEYSPSYFKMSTHVVFGLEKFHLEGVDGTVANWSDFGKWYYTNLIAGTDELSPETVSKIKTIVGTETDPIKKAKLVYEYVQSKTRYISIQLGIGGWKPMLAKDVDRLGYGDCKALSNYTRALLKAVEVESYCAVIYGDTQKRDINEDFVSMQGNHMILGIPNNDKIVWLECTSQVAPFGFQGNFTDDRLALLLKPTDSKLYRTSVYGKEINLQDSKGSYSITGTGGINGSLIISSKGTQYDNKYWLESKSKDDRDKYYKSGFSTIGNLKLKKTDIKNNKDKQEIIEDIALEADAYCSKSGDKLIFAPNAFNQYSRIPQRYRIRKNPFEISRGFTDTDEITISLPEGFAMESKPEDVTISEKYGEYSAKYVTGNNGSLIYKRSLVINPGYYASTEYESYRQFREKIARNDNAKVVLVKK